MQVIFTYVTAYECLHYNVFDTCTVYVKEDQLPPVLAPLKLDSVV